MLIYLSCPASNGVAVHCGIHTHLDPGDLEGDCWDRCSPTCLRMGPLYTSGDGLDFSIQRAPQEYDLWLPARERGFFVVAGIQMSKIVVVLPRA